MSEEDGELDLTCIEENIEDMKTKLETIRLIKNRLIQLQDRADVTIVGDSGARTFRVIIIADEPIAMMKELADIDKFLKGKSHSPEQMEYDIENDEYRLDMQFRTDR